MDTLESLLNWDFLRIFLLGLNTKYSQRIFLANNSHYIVLPVENRYHYHLNNDTKHDGIFVDQVLHDQK